MILVMQKKHKLSTGSTHFDLNSFNIAFSHSIVPLNWLTPKIPKRRNTMNMMICRFSSDGRELINEFIARLSPSLLEMIFNGRRILRIRMTLNVDRETDEFDEDMNKSKEDIATIRKSEQFDSDRKYELVPLNSSPSDKIFMPASIIKHIVMT